jgi:hypothetical protein
MPTTVHERRLGMTLRHGNRIRHTGGEQVVRELLAMEPGGLAAGGPTEAEIRQRAHEIYLSRGGAPGNAVLDWLQAEAELRAPQKQHTSTESQRV